MRNMEKMYKAAELQRRRYDLLMAVEDAFYYDTDAYELWLDIKEVENQMRELGVWHWFADFQYPYFN